MLLFPLSSLKPCQLEAIKHTPTDPGRHGQDHDHHRKDRFYGRKGKHRPLLALTFSKEAARNIREKVEKLLQGNDRYDSNFATFIFLESPNASATDSHFVFKRYAIGLKSYSVIVS